MAPASPLPNVFNATLPYTEVEVLSALEEGYSVQCSGDAHWPDAHMAGAQTAGAHTAWQAQAQEEGGGSSSEGSVVLSGVTNPLSRSLLARPYAHTFIFYTNI